MRTILLNCFLARSVSQPDKRYGSSRDPGSFLNNSAFKNHCQAAQSGRYTREILRDSGNSVSLAQRSKATGEKRAVSSSHLYTEHAFSSRLEMNPTDSRWGSITFPLRCCRIPHQVWRVLCWPEDARHPEGLSAGCQVYLASQDR